AIGHHIQGAMPSGTIDTTNMTLNDHLAKKAFQKLVRLARGAASETGALQLSRNRIAVGMHQLARHRPSMLLAAVVGPLQQQSVVIVAIIARPGHDIERTADFYRIRFRGRLLYDAAADTTDRYRSARNDAAE